MATVLVAWIDAYYNRTNWRYIYGVTLLVDIFAMIVANSLFIIYFT